MSHTILLVKLTPANRSRSYSKYESVNMCLEGVCKLYGEHLKIENPHSSTVSYELRELFDYIDSLEDICCMVYQKASGTYAPYGRDWIKEKIMVLMRNAAMSME
ncbi:uncharacterized protein Dwil_GK15131 [Drosophila willistoni]|uniref:Protein enhancer of rudimentary n=1 Tax=Drosophila willistoni TaxID=7260 RepID=B4MVS6_DROWI|nr:protein enhancer of rudimentary [Drosophila willistoni]EDW75796.1 uncharacterized protein Dwil_GK15131 [Drosophila willistoni]